MTAYPSPVGGEDLDATAAPQVIIRSGQDRTVLVRLHERRFTYETVFAVDIRAGGLAAHYRDVSVAAPEDLSDFIDALATDFRGWSGTRSWAANYLKLTADFHSGGHVELRWTLGRWISRQDSWEASVTTWLEAGQQMTMLAADVRAFLARSQPM